MSYIKDFVGWNNVKARLNGLSHGPTFQEREIWWCGIGVNIGDEMDGKGNNFNRPVMIIRKFNVNLFWGVPLSKQIKDNLYYFPIHFNGIDQSVLLTQFRLWESRRLTHKMGQMPENQFHAVKTALKKLF